MVIMIKKKTTFTMLRTVCKEGLHLLFFFLQFLVLPCLFLFCTIMCFYLLVYFFLIQKLMNVFVDYTNAALMRFATILKVHIIAHANMDSREMDENVEVDIGFNSNYVMKK